ncbi:MAG: H-NS histone family protein [Burkholderiaceae bacterium]|nr:H-NS histone family protein [Burkholderiaceae bacterium]
MQTLKQIEEQIAQLQKQARELKKKNFSSAVVQVKAMMSEYGITPSDLGFSGKKGDRNRVPLPPKYQNPNTGETWSGRGKPPKWFDRNNEGNFRVK